MHLHEHRDTVPPGYTLTRPAAHDTPLHLRIALTQTDIKGLQDKLLDVSTPSSPNYGKHLSKEEVGAFVVPKPETLAAVNAWLAENGLNGSSTSPFGDWISVQVTVGLANELFATQFSEFTHESTGETTVRTLQYSIPAHLRGHLELVHPTITFPGPKQVGHPLAAYSPKQRRSSTTTGDHSIGNRSVAACNNNVTPACVQALYGVPTTSSSQSFNSIAVTGFFEEYANRADLQSFLSTFRPDLPSTNTFTLQTIDGGKNPQSPDEAGLIAGLGVQYTIGIASGVSTFFISVGSNNHDGLEGFLDIVNSLLGEAAPPTVLTTSFGFDESSISPALAKSLCNAYMQLGARGVSIIFASGDGGVGGSQRRTCTAFVPTFPSSCPFITSVGATRNDDGEVAAADFSSGGFSNIFSAPAYQTSATRAYLNRVGSTYAGRYNANGRAYPDVAAIGDAVAVVYKGSTAAVSTTGASSPIFASVVALLNDRLVAAGEPVLGFLNPFLYSIGASALNDITSGSNPGCSTNGFPATTGWDPVTGLGTPNFAKLLAALGL
ncbi:family S53 protease-like protein [Russula compacta]|nr:family S53 protease-like protein [Russula compacta]